GAENQLCPTAAIKRTYVEDPYYEYTIDEQLCIGCAKCVEGCNRFGNGSLFLQIRHDRCVNCNECSIARVCPGDAFRRQPASRISLRRPTPTDRCARVRTSSPSCSCWSLAPPRWPSNAFLLPTSLK